uniref:Uncharacterized protein n=1 Tax=Picea sitchensis TaxID=3332 RepID=A9NMA9_PICSI|nr:unknown [Picea sitchensis]
MVDDLGEFYIKYYVTEVNLTTSFSSSNSVLMASSTMQTIQTARTTASSAKRFFLLGLFSGNADSSLLKASHVFFKLISKFSMVLE